MTAFNTASISPVQILGEDGQNPAGAGNPLAVAIHSAAVITAIISGAISLAASTASIGSTTIIGSLPAGTNPLGKINFNASAAQLSSVPLSFSAPGTSVIVTGVASTIISVYRMVLANSTAGTLTFRNGTTPLTGDMSLAANGQLNLPLDGEPYFVCSTGANLGMSLSTTSQIAGRLYYLQA